jgi:hypothetical protein
VYLCGRKRVKVRCAGLQRKGVDDVDGRWNRRRRIHACHMRRRIHACHMRRRIRAWKECGVDDVDLFSMKL